MCLCGMCSKILNGVDVSETGRWLEGSSLSPDLKKGLTFAKSQSEGNEADERDCV